MLPAVPAIAPLALIPDAVEVTAPAVTDPPVTPSVLVTRNNIVPPVPDDIPPMSPTTPGPLVRPELAPLPLAPFGAVAPAGLLKAGLLKVGLLLNGAAIVCSSYIS